MYIHTYIHTYIQTFKPKMFAYTNTNFVVCTETVTQHVDVVPVLQQLHVFYSCTPDRVPVIIVITTVSRFNVGNNQVAHSKFCFEKNASSTEQGVLRIRGVFKFFLRNFLFQSPNANKKKIKLVVSEAQTAVVVDV